MQYTERQKRIMDLLRKRSMSVCDIASALSVSEMTVRRDISYLKEMGTVTQFRGGVAIKNFSAFRYFETRVEEAKDEKILLARKAVQYVKDGMLIFIDNSSTCYYIAPLLENFHNLMVVTNSSKVLSVLGELGIKVKMTSGNYNHRDKCVIGSETEEYIRNYRYDIAFLSASGSDKEIITSMSDALTNVRRAVIQSAARSYFLMIPSKTNRRSKFVICRTEDVELITL